MNKFNCIFTVFLSMFFTAFSFSAYSAQICQRDSIQPSTQDNQFIDNGDGTVTDIKTNLMWKKCVEGVSGVTCNIGYSVSFNWQQALERPNVVNTGGGFAGYTDWRLPNIRELLSIVEDQCSDPAINLNFFPNTSNSILWSSSPESGNSDSAWTVYFGWGFSSPFFRNDSSYFSYIMEVRLVRGGQ